MPGFLKVRAVHGPKHIFYAPTETVDAWPDEYEILDKEPVDAPGEVEYVTTSKAPAVEVKSLGDHKEGAI